MQQPSWKRTVPIKNNIIASPTVSNVNSLVSAIERWKQITGAVGGIKLELQPIVIIVN